MRLKLVMPGRLIVVTALIMMASMTSYGQSSIMPGNLEVSGNLGVVGGIGGSHGSFGGSVGAPLTDKLILSGDLSYIPFGGGTVTINGSTIKTSANAFNFNGTLQYQFKPTHSVVPYGAAGLGFLRSSSSTSSTGTGPGAFNVSGSSTNLYFNTGGGLRYYVADRWGFRPEFMVFAGTNTYVRFAGGIFYQFGE